MPRTEFALDGELSKQGRTHYQLGECLGAPKKFQEAYRLKQDALGGLPS